MSSSHQAPPRRLIRSDVLPAPRFRYTQAVSANGFAFVSGLVGLDPVSGVLSQGGAYGQAFQVLSNFRALCEEQGWALAQLVRATIYCAEITDFAEVNRAWDEFFATVAPPARTSLAGLALPLGAAVEIDFQLAVA